MPAPGIKTAQKNTTGGFNTASIYSGAVAPSLTACPGAVAGGSDVLLFSGAGRLDLIMQHQPVQSGLSIYFYDTGVVTSGGPFPSSGHKIIGVLPPTWRVPTGVTVASGQTNFVDSQPGFPIQVSMPFQSGLALNSRSGQAGVTVCWTPETPNQ